VHVTGLDLTDFRSYERVELSLTPGPSVLVGPNGQGKTNLIEALGYAATLRSHRVSQDAPMIRQGAPRALVRVAARRGERSVLIELELNAGRANRARVNRTPVPRPRDVLGQVSRVLFCPEDLSMVKGDPSERRDYLDELLVALHPRFHGVLEDLQRVLRQRNSLLKSASALRGGGSRARAAAEQTIGVWDDQLATLSAQVVVARHHLVERLADPLAIRYRSVAPAERDPQPVAVYVCGVSDVTGWTPEAVATAIHDALLQRRDEEFARGVTLVGPHRDEVRLSLHGMPVRGYASHGESWSLALALRLASYDLLRADAGPYGAPVLVLDDVFAELDSQRRARLADAVADVEQVLVTAAVTEDVPAALARRVIAVGGTSVGAA
jgi:DNA replication and repair protein RecF